MKYSNDVLVLVAKKMICNLDQVKLACARGAYDDLIARNKKQNGDNHTSYMELRVSVDGCDEPFGASVDLDMKGHTMFDIYCVFTHEQYLVWRRIMEQMLDSKSVDDEDYVIIENILIDIEDGDYPGSVETVGHYLTLADFTTILLIMYRDARIDAGISDDGITMLAIDHRLRKYFIGDLLKMQTDRYDISLPAEIVNNLELKEATKAILNIPTLNGTWELLKSYEDYSVSFMCTRMPDEYDFDYGVKLTISKPGKPTFIRNIPIYSLADIHLAVS